MTSLDPGRTRAILLGASRGCRSLGVSDLRAPRTNLSEFRKVLQDEAILGLPDDNVLLRHEPSDSLRLLREVGEFAKGAEDTLIVYYTGHGFISGGFKELYLWIPEVEAIAETIRYDDLRNRFLPPARSSRSTIVILDCCYAEAARKSGMGEGECLLAAAPRTRKAYAHPEERLSVFTEALITTLNEGIPNAGPELRMRQIYGEVNRRITQRRSQYEEEKVRIPPPSFTADNENTELTLCRNLSYRAPEPYQSPKKTDLIEVIRTALRSKSGGSYRYGADIGRRRAKSIARKFGIDRTNEEIIAAFGTGMFSADVVLTEKGIRFSPGSKPVPYSELAEVEVVSETIKIVTPARIELRPIGPDAAARNPSMSMVPVHVPESTSYSTTRDLRRQDGQFITSLPLSNADDIRIFHFLLSTIKEAVAG